MTEDEVAIEEVRVNGTTYKLRKLKAGDLLDAMDLSDGQKGYSVQIMLQRALVEPKMDIEDIKKIDLKEFIKILDKMNKMNGLDEKDFMIARKK